MASAPPEWWPVARPVIYILCGLFVFANASTVDPSTQFGSQLFYVCASLACFVRAVSSAASASGSPALPASGGYSRVGTFSLNDDDDDNNNNSNNFNNRDSEERGVAIDGRRRGAGGVVAGPVGVFGPVGAVFAGASARARAARIALAVAGIALGIWAVGRFGPSSSAAKNRGLSAHYNRVIILQLSALFLIFYAVYKLARRFLTLAQGAAVCFLCLFLIAARIVVVSRAYSVGLHGVPISGSHDAGECALDSFPVPWAAVLPPRTMNFWTGSHTCPGEPIGARWATLDGDGRVVLDCPRSEGGVDTRAVVELDPDWGSWRLPEQLREMRMLYARHAPPREIPYEGRPIEVPAGTEFVLARCGAETKMLTVNKRVDRVYDRARAEVEARASGAPAALPAAPAAPGLGGRDSLAPSPYPQERLPLNSLFLVIDSLSRAHFLRRMEKTVKWLEDVSRPGADGKQAYRLYQFFRYNVVGKNTFPNMTPIVTGQAVADPEHEPVANASRLFYWGQPYDGRGYARAYAINLCQDYFGFYWNASATQMDHELDYAYCNPEYEPLRRSNFQGPYSLGARCIGGVPASSFEFKFLRQFFDNYDGVGRVALGKFMEAHEGSMEVIATLDEPFRDYLNWMDARGYLSNTVTVIASDHGSHMSPYALFSEPGAIERRLAMLNILVPEKIAKAYPEVAANLEANQHKLVSAFDIHKTLKHIATLPDPVPPTADPADEPKFGTSLFDKIPSGRKCADAGIPDEWCACR